MSDLVERLRGFDDALRDIEALRYREAADEIERLRKALAIVKEYTNAVLRGQKAELEQNEQSG